jgi:hypothetical protein
MSLNKIKKEWQIPGKGQNETLEIVTLLESQRILTDDTFSLAATCLKMVARATFCVTVHCEIAAACCLLKRSTFGDILHFTLPSSVTEKPPTVSSCCWLKRSTFGVVISILRNANLLLLFHHCSMPEGSWSGMILLFIHMQLTHCVGWSKCMLYRSNYWSTINFQEVDKSSLLWFFSRERSWIFNFVFSYFLACSLISSKRIELYATMCFSKFCRSSINETSGSVTLQSIQVCFCSGVVSLILIFLGSKLSTSDDGRGLWRLSSNCLLPLRIWRKCRKSFVKESVSETLLIVCFMLSSLFILFFSTFLFVMYLF